MSHTPPDRKQSGDDHSTTSARRPDHPFSVSSLVVAETAVLSLSGRVDLASLPICRHAVDGLLRDGVQQITVDLQVARFDDESIALLALMRRYTARHGTRMILAEIPPHVGELLDRTGVRWLYRNDEASEDASGAGGHDSADPGRPRRTGREARTWSTWDSRGARG